MFWSSSGQYSDSELCENWVKKRYPKSSVIDINTYENLFCIIHELHKEGKKPTDSLVSYDDYCFSWWYEIEYKNKGEFCSEFMRYCTGYKYHNKKEDKRVNKVLEDLEISHKIVESVIHNLDGPYGQKIDCKYGFVFHRFEFIGRHLIDIKRPSIDELYITIGVSEEREANEMGNKKITGFYLIGTNGSLEHLRKAIDCTKHLW